MSSDSRNQPADLLAFCHSVFVGTALAWKPWHLASTLDSRPRSMRRRSSNYFKSESKDPRIFNTRTLTWCKVLIGNSPRLPVGIHGPRQAVSIQSEARGAKKSNALKIRSRHAIGGKSFERPSNSKALFTHEAFSNRELCRWVGLMKAYPLPKKPTITFSRHARKAHNCRIKVCGIESGALDLPRLR